MASTSVSDPQLLSALRRTFGFDAFRPGQMQAVKAVLQGEHALVVMPTGAGKSLCYQLPAIVLRRTAPVRGTSLVISPLIALMKDQVDALREKQIEAAYLNSTLTSNEQNRCLDALAAGDLALLYVAPERLRSTRFQQALAQTQINLLAVDEAHCISQWGHDFRPDYLSIGSVWRNLGSPTLIATTATATQTVQNDILRQLGIPDAQRIVTGFNRPNLLFEARATPTEADKQRALRSLLTPPDIYSPVPSAIVYVGTRREAESVAQFVREAVQVRAVTYHGGLEPEQRADVQDAWIGGNAPVVVATNAFGMGVDKPDVRLVIHWSIPGTQEAYYQEAGRAGRDGLPARCVILYSPEDRTLQEFFIDNDAPTEAEMRTLWEFLKRQAGVDEPAAPIRLSTYELERASNLNQVKWRLGMSQLEQAGALDYLGDARGVLMLKVNSSTDPDLSIGRAMVEARRATKRAQLQAMIDYAEKDKCRRRVLLDHFGDRILADVPEPGQGEGKDPCCDVCNRKLGASDSKRAQSQGEWIALIVLETVRTLGKEVGRSKIAQLLKGSRSQELERTGLMKHRFHGKLAAYSLDNIDEFLVQLMDWGLLRVTGAEYPVVQMTEAGKTALRNREALPLALPGGKTTTKAKPQHVSGVNSSILDTANLIRQGLTPEQIGMRRNLSAETIYQHLSRLISEGKIKLDEVVPVSMQAAIRAAIAEVGSTGLMNPIKQRVGDAISYGQIRCVIAAMPRSSANSRIQPGAAPTASASASGDTSYSKRPAEIGANSKLFEALRTWRAKLAQTQSVPTYVIFSDAVLYDIARRRPLSFDELAQIKGVGEAKLEAYGEAVLAVIRET